MLAVASLASADDVSPEDEARRRECTIARQSSGGAQCVTCTRTVGQAQHCDGPIAGKTERCGYGATHHTSIWCSGPQPRNGAMGCAVHPGAAPGGVLLALAMMLWARRRRA
jgi:MYXO-CTERM domain-containing protein